MELPSLELLRRVHSERKMQGWRQEAGRRARGRAGERLREAPWQKGEEGRQWEKTRAGVQEHQMGQDCRVPVLPAAETLSALGTVVCEREREVRLSEGPFHT